MVHFFWLLLFFIAGLWTPSFAFTPRLLKTKGGLLHPLLLNCKVDGGVKDGGDFIGLSATFDLRGRLIPVPEHLIPESMLEWGQAPTCLETILSEDDSSHIILTILPETGCAVDNLETLKSKLLILEKNNKDNVRASILVEEKNKNPQERILEAAFQAEENEHCRLRCSVPVVLNSISDVTLQGPIRITLERQFRSESSSGSLADGGGLDGQSITRWMGEFLKTKYTFAEASRPSQGSFDQADIISLPQNVNLRVWSKDSDLMIEMSHFSQSVLWHLQPESSKISSLIATTDRAEPTLL